MWGVSREARRRAAPRTGVVGDAQELEPERPQALPQHDPDDPLRDGGIVGAAGVADGDAVGNVGEEHSTPDSRRGDLRTAGLPGVGLIRCSP